MRPMSSSVAIGLTADEHEGEEGGSVDLGRCGDHGAASAGAGGPATPPRGGARVGDGHGIEQVNPRFSVKEQGRPICLCWGEWGRKPTGWGSAEGKFGLQPIRHEICREKKLARASSLRAPRLRLGLGAPTAASGQRPS